MPDQQQRNDTGYQTQQRQSQRQQQQKQQQIPNAASGTELPEKQQQSKHNTNSVIVQPGSQSSDQ